MKLPAAAARHQGCRPRAVRQAIASFIVLFALLAGLPSAAATGESINSYRTSSGLPPVELHSGLASLAREHAQAMADQGRLFHSSNLGGRVGSVVPDWSAVAENVGTGRSMQEIDEAFMASSSHRANILGDFTLAGVGAVTDAHGKLWVTQVFARTPAPAPPPPPPPPPAPPPPPPPADDDRTAIAPRASRTRTAPAPVPAPAPRLSGFTAGSVAAPALGRWGTGYFLFDAEGGVHAYGGAGFAGSISGSRLRAPVVGGASTPRGHGYWLATADGGVFALGDAPFLGSAATRDLAAAIVGMAPARGTGYWLAGEDGGVFAFGDAEFYGGLADVDLDSPVASVASTPTGKGYWLVSESGGVFAFGDARFQGGLVGIDLNAPVAAIASTSTGKGYWLVGEDGGVFAFGDAVHRGGLGDAHVDEPIRAIVPDAVGSGYRLVSKAGEVFTFAPDRPARSERDYIVYAELFVR